MKALTKQRQQIAIKYFPQNDAVLVTKEEFRFDPEHGIVEINPLKRYGSGQLLAELMKRDAISFTGNGDGSFWVEDDL